jgi:hypothetical protein
LQKSGDATALESSGPNNIDERIISGLRKANLSICGSYTPFRSGDVLACSCWAEEDFSFACDSASCDSACLTASAIAVSEPSGLVHLVYGDKLLRQQRLKSM